MKKLIYLSCFLIVSIHASILAQNPPLEDLYGSWSAYEFNNICNQAWDYFTLFDMTISPLNSNSSDTLNLEITYNSSVLADTSFTAPFVLFELNSDNFQLIAVGNNPFINNNYVNTINLSSPDSIIFTSTDVCLACSCGTISYMAKPSTTSNINLIDEWQIFPNPTSDLVKIRTEINSKAQLTLYSANGRLLKKQHLNTNEGLLSLDGLKQGLYYLEMEANGKKRVEKIFKL